VKGSQCHRQPNIHLAGPDIYQHRWIALAQGKNGVFDLALCFPLQILARALCLALAQSIIAFVLVQVLLLRLGFHPLVWIVHHTVDPYFAVKDVWGFAIETRTYLAGVDRLLLGCGSCWYGERARSRLS
jgi:hypothetical protein